MFESGALGYARDFGPGVPVEILHASPEGATGVQNADPVGCAQDDKLLREITEEFLQVARLVCAQLWIRKESGERIKDNDRLVGPRYNRLGDGNQFIFLAKDAQPGRLRLLGVQMRGGTGG